MVASYFLVFFTFLSLYFSYRPTIGSISWILSLIGTCFYGPLITLHILFLFFYHGPLLVLSLLGLLIHFVYIFTLYKKKGPFQFIHLFFKIPEFWSQPSEKLKLTTGNAHFYKASRVDAPCIILIFGGGFVAGGPAQLVHLMRALQKQGFHVIALPYRTLPEGQWPLSIEDLMQGAQQVLQLKRKDFSPQEFHIAGRSAGGFLALMLSHHLKFEKRILSVTALYPICDLNVWSRDSGSIRVLNSDKIVNQLKLDQAELSVNLRQIDQNLNRRYWIVTGDFDQHVNPQHSRWIYESLKIRGCRVEMTVFPLQNHAFDVNRYSLAGQVFFKTWVKILVNSTDDLPA